MYWSYVLEQLLFILTEITLITFSHSLNNDIFHYEGAI